MLETGSIIDGVTIAEYSDIYKCRLGIKGSNVYKIQSEHRMELLRLNKLLENPYIVHKDIIEVYDINGVKFIIDRDDERFIREHIWRVDNRGYVISQERSKTIYIHREIMDIKDRNILVEHKNGIHTENTKNNLRLTNKKEKSRSRGKLPNNSTGVVGVSINEGRYRARIWVNNKAIELGTENTLREAELLRIKAEDSLYG